MRHGEARRMMAARRYLSPDEQHRLDQHLAGCPACRVEEEEIERQDAFLTALPALTPAPSLRHAVLTTPASTTTRTRRPNRSAGLACRLPAPLLTGLAIVLVLVAAVLHTRPQPTRHVSTQATGQVTGGATSVSRDTPQGLRITLTAPTTVPRGALMDATVRLTNISQQDVLLEQAGTEFGAQILTDETAGTPAVDGGFGMIGAGGGNEYVSPMQLHPGASVEGRFYGAAVGRYLRASAQVQDKRGYAATAEGPTLTLTLTDGAAPDVELRTIPDVQLTMQPPSADPGPLLYNATTSCMEENGNEHEMGGLHGGWSTSPVSTLTPQWPAMPNFNGICTHDFEWHVTAGYVGQRVVHFDYIAPTIATTAGTEVSLRRTTCGADRSNLPEVPAGARHAAGEAEVVRAACRGLDGSIHIDVASMAQSEWKNLASSSGDGTGDRWVWIVVLHGTSGEAGSLTSYAYDGLSGQQLDRCACNWLSQSAVIHAAPTARVHTPPTAQVYAPPTPQVCSSPSGGPAAPQHGRPLPVPLKPGYVVNRVWVGAWSGNSVQITSGYLRNEGNRGVISVRGMAHCTGIIPSGLNGDYPTPNGVGIPTITTVKGNVVTFSTRAGTGYFNLNTRIYSSSHHQHLPGTS